MENQSLRQRLRKLGAAAIERKVKEIALLCLRGTVRCTWNLGQDMSFSDTHRLDVQIEGIETRLYFTDREILTYSNDKNRRAVDNRLKHALNQLFDA